MGMYFYDIDEPGEYCEDDPGDVVCTCRECGCNQMIDYNKFKEFHEDYVVLNEGESICCERCGEPAEQIITRRPEHLDPFPSNKNVPLCPICHSPNIHKIKLGTKVSRAAIFGIFALPKAGKEWHCDNCGSEF
ncbi:hypothetical protein NE556_12210 [[Clostridium] symbiosum]|uniref:hypothetical protein n=1 Tax=Clostridium symbiosum TaxID=1512 RepID=UPI00210B7943|nr:hypothetical protein [[Clostridium] symbiosum]MCQ4835969.1 hypothetical protein [[Clostridium] symbiosum]